MALDVEQLIEEIRRLPAADQRRVREALDGETESNGDQPRTERKEEEYQRMLVEAGLLKKVATRPPRDPKAFDQFEPVKILGKPLSETIIEERR